MPFRLKFKKTRRYEISSKNSYVVGVHMLDNSFLECTLTYDSTGQECLDSIAQRIELGETHYFGLRYVTKKLQFRWVDLEKPLKKQLDKFAQVSHALRLYFGVAFYVAGAHKIQDDMTRYQYYLQLKNDVVDGRLPLTVEQAIRLAAVGLQADFGDHDYEKHTPESFKDYPLYPKSMTRDENTLLELIADALHGHSSLIGIHPVKAEIQYISEMQNMDGYGMEYYLAKDENGKELYLGTSYLGIFSRYLDGQPGVFFKWSEIARMTKSKKTFAVEKDSKSSKHYQMEDSDSAKYLRRMCIHQQKFYKSNKSILNTSMNDMSMEFPPDTDSNKNIIDPQSQTTLRADIPDLAASQNSLANSQDQGFSQEVQSLQSSTDSYYGHSQQSLDNAIPEVIPQQAYVDNVLLSTNLYNLNQQHLMQQQQQQQMQQQQQQQQHQSVVQPSITSSQSDPTYAARLAALPSYRTCPDYEMLMQQRVSQQVGQVMAHDVQHHNISSAQIYTQDGLAYSQPEIRQNLNNFPSEMPDYVNTSNLRNYGHTAYPNYHTDQNYFQFRAGDKTNNLVIKPTYSSPELNTQGLPQQFNTENIVTEDIPYHYKPPPPYPRTSNSTPDLAAQPVRTDVSNSPDLVSRKNIGVTPQTDIISTVDVIPSSNIQQTPMTLVPPTVDVDDASSDHSNVTFHAKETDEESSAEEEKIQQNQTKIEIRYVEPDKAPPHSASKQVATLRESFRRMMIARVAPVTPVTHSEKLLESSEHTDKQDSVVCNMSTLERMKPVNVLASDEPSSQNERTETNVPSIKVSGVNSEKSTESTENTSVSEDSVKEADEVAAFHMRSKSAGPTFCVPDNEANDEYDSDTDSERSSTLKHAYIGPLKFAALNGLTLSRPLILSLMNDETRAPKDERRKILENKLSEGKVFKEFEIIPKRAANLECSVGKMAENKTNNRFKDVLPYDVTRVKLKQRKNNPTGYINASHIKLSAGKQEWWFVATQAPLENTVADFWQMIIEHEVDVIAMLTALEEDGKKKCFPYWPQESGEENKLIFGEYEVILQFCNDSLCYITSQITVRHVTSNKKRLIWHLQYTDWPDHGCPDDIYGFIGFLDEMESVQRLAESEEGSGKKSPLVVHCSAGVGRTGVVILTQVMKWCLEHNHSIDLQKALAGIRHQRMFMVQTLAQYNFIHKTLIQYLKNTRLI